MTAQGFPRRQPGPHPWQHLSVAMGLMSVAGVLTGCASSPDPSAAPARVEASATPAAVPFALGAAAPQPSAFELELRERAFGHQRARRLADAAIAWEILAVLRPDVAEYRGRHADMQRQLDAAVAERLPRADQAARRGEIESASQHYLAVLALQPQHRAAAQALRDLERERNSRQNLGKLSRLTITRQAKADSQALPVAASMAAGNDVEHAAMLAGDGELDEAIALLERRLGAEHRDVGARLLLASLYQRKGESLAGVDRALAIDALQKSLRLHPGDPGATELLRRLTVGRGAQVPGTVKSAAPPHAGIRSKP